MSDPHKLSFANPRIRGSVDQINLKSYKRCVKLPLPSELTLTL
jgi:hypothetical protein